LVGALIGRIATPFAAAGRIGTIDATRLARISERAAETMGGGVAR
jgi:hypothetical protein